MDVEQLKEDVREGRVKVDRLADLIGTLQGKLAEANERIWQREEMLDGSPPAKVDEPFSVKAEETLIAANRR